MPIKTIATRVQAELTEKQKQLDINQDGEISSDDLKKLREGAKPGDTKAVVSASSFLARAKATAVTAATPKEMISFLATLGIKNPRKIAKGLIEHSNTDIAFELSTNEAFEINDQIEDTLGAPRREKGGKNGKAVVRFWPISGKGRLALTIDPNTDKAELRLINKG